MTRSVQPRWCLDLPIQQQSVLLLASRGPDGIGKWHPCKDVHRAYRATVLVDAKLGRCIQWGEGTSTWHFSSLHTFANGVAWADAVKRFFGSVDELPHHYLLHLVHGSEIIGYKHPDHRFADRWRGFYLACVEDMHLTAETEAEMDIRLNDWDQADWEPSMPPVRQGSSLHVSTCPRSNPSLSLPSSVECSCTKAARG